MSTRGVDYSWSRPNPAGLFLAGFRFAVRYVSPTEAKNLTAGERDALWAAGLAVALVWENHAGDALDGAAGGTSDGYNARAKAAALGFPASRPIYHAVDVDVTTAQMAGPVTRYLRAAAKQHGGVDKVGIYGGHLAVKYALDHGLVGWAWQTYAWSGKPPVWDPRAVLRQVKNGQVVAGGTVDLCEAMAADFGQWTPPSRQEIDVNASDKLSNGLTVDQNITDVHYVLTSEDGPNGTRVPMQTWCAETTAAIAAIPTAATVVTQDQVDQAVAKALQDPAIADALAPALAAAIAGRLKATTTISGQ